MLSPARAAWQSNQSDPARRTGRRPGRAGTGASLAVAKAAEQGLATEFLTLHRVLTDAVQVRATAPEPCSSDSRNQRANSAP
jgi:hypothetical protein